MKKLISNDLLSYSFLLLIIGVITVIHYLTPSHLSHYHDLLRRLYYIPLFLALFRWGQRGGMLCAFFITISYLPHFFLQHGGMNQSNLPKILEMFSIYVFAILFGWLRNKSIRVTKKLDLANKKLLKSNDELRDTTKLLLESDKALRLTDKMKTIGDLTSSFAHEIKNPLASLMGAAQICAKEGQGKIKKFADIVGSEALRLNNTLTHLLAFVRKEKVEVSKVGVEKAVLHATELARLIKDDRQLNIEIDLEEGTFIFEQGGELSQCVFNLLKNAIEATDYSLGVVTLEAYDHENDIIINIIDNGSGPENPNELFTPFYTTKTDGTGLGLSISYKIVESMNGSLNWRRLNNKSIFTIMIPLVEKEKL